MVEKPDFPHSKPPTNSGPQGSQAPKDFQGEHKGWEAKPMRWLGMEFNATQAKQLWNIISQNVSNEIKKLQDKAVKAIKKLNPENGDSDDS
jgi:hypothetical protein